jgi:hypothetical protein
MSPVKVRRCSKVVCNPAWPASSVSLASTLEV